MLRGVNKLLCGVVGSLVLATGSAAADRTMVVVIDASGSMQITRPGDGQARFNAARTLAADRVVTAAMEVDGLSGVAVYMFHGTGITAHTPGFVLPFDAVTAINGLTVTSELTPLAGSMCDTIDIARTSGTGATTTRFLEMYTDGGENNTDPLHACFGPYSVSTTAPFDAGSWHNKVFLRATNLLPAVTIAATLFHNVSGVPGSIDPEAAALAKLGRPATSALPGLVSDAVFFSTLAAATGGTFQAIAGTAPLPVFADLDGDFDVDRDDAILLARSFGAPAVRSFDLDASGTIGFADYAILLGRFGPGSGTPVPDPYVQAQTLSCTGDRTEVVIDGKVIEDGGITISANEKCHVIIRNSLVVSGQAAIRVHGGARLTVDDSIIVGEKAWIAGNGSTTLSAARSVFHGAERVGGKLKITDRGGNVFE